MASPSVSALMWSVVGRRAATGHARETLGRGAGLLPSAGALSALIQGSAASPAGQPRVRRPPILRGKWPARFELGKWPRSGVAFTFFALQYVIEFQWLIKACSVAKHWCRIHGASKKVPASTPGPFAQG